MTVRVPYLSEPPIPFAHRGGAAAGDENTADAFARAVGLGYRYIETDVHATADGVVVVFHDHTLRRMTGRSERIARLRWADLATVRVGGAAAVPRLDEVLSAWPDVRFNIDIKADQATYPTIETVQHGSTHDRVLLASFSDTRLAIVRRELPTVATSLGQAGVARLWRASRLNSAIQLPDSVVAAQVPPRYLGLRVVDRRFVAYAHRLGLHVHVWTVDDPARMTALLDLGVDGLMTDRPDVLKTVLQARGVWPSDGSSGDHPEPL